MPEGGAAKHGGCFDCKSTAQAILWSTYVPSGPYKGVGLALCDACRATRIARGEAFDKERN